MVCSGAYLEGEAISAGNVAESLAARRCLQMLGCFEAQQLQQHLHPYAHAQCIQLSIAVWLKCLMLLRVFMYCRP